MPLSSRFRDEDWTCLLFQIHSRFIPGLHTTTQNLEVALGLATTRFRGEDWAASTSACNCWNFNSLFCSEIGIILLGNQRKGRAREEVLAGSSGHLFYPNPERGGSLFCGAFSSIGLMARSKNLRFSYVFV